MTTGELLNQESTVSNTTALIHLQNIQGTGGGTVNHYIPFTEVLVSFDEQILDVSFVDEELAVTFDDIELEVVFDDEELLITFDRETVDINVTC